MTDEAGNAGRASSLVNAKAACGSHLRETCRTGTVAASQAQSCSPSPWPLPPNSFERTASPLQTACPAATGPAADRTIIPMCGRQAEPPARRMRPMGMTTSVPRIVPIFACALLSACTGGTTGSTEGGDCVSHYEPVARASTWNALKEAMLHYTDRGPVASVRTQAVGHRVGAGNQDAVRVVDLLNRHGRRLVQVDVWRTQGGGWRAGVWSQCID
jgi:hypothetical protein